HIVRKVGLDESPVGIKIAGRNINNLRYADDTTLMAESEEELKSLLMRVKEESAKVGLKLNIKKMKIMASGPLTFWQIDGEEMEVVTDFIFLGSKITTDSDCSQEIERRLLLGRKAMANLDSILKSRDITLPTKMCIVKAMVFSFAMYGCESWTIRKAERRRIETFELWCWRRLLRVPWTARRPNRSVLEEINADCSLEGQILKMKLKYFGHLMRRKDSLEKPLMLGTIEGKRRRGRQRMRWLDGVTEAVGVSLSGLREMVEDRKAWRNVRDRLHSHHDLGMASACCEDRAIQSLLPIPKYHMIQGSPKCNERSRGDKVPVTGGEMKALLFPFIFLYLLDWACLFLIMRLKLKKVGKNTRPLRQDLNHIPDEYTVEVTNRFKELDQIHRVPKELWTEVRNIVQEVATKRWQDYTEELYKKELNVPDNHDGVVTDLNPDILECEVKWVLGSLSNNKASGGDKHIMRKVGLDESPVGIKIAGRNINNLRYADDTTLMAESEEELKSLLMRVKEESTKVGLKLNIKKMKIMASSPLTFWQIDGEEMESSLAMLPPEFPGERTGAAIGVVMGNGRNSSGGLTCPHRRRRDRWLTPVPTSGFAASQKVPGSLVSRPSGLTVLLFNARSANNKSALIHDLIVDEGADLACITETWVGKGGDVALSQLCPPGYMVQHCSRPEGRGGGVALVYRASFTLTGLPVPSRPGLECLYLVLGDRDRLGILLVYRAPFCPTVSLPELTDTVSDLVLRTPRMLVLGDFNIHAEASLTGAAQDFMASMTAMGLSQHVTGPTHERGHTLDLVFSTGQEEGGLRVRN
ncbi:putative uncharacterized transposon-derived protein F52C9.6, partial [Varanus komodoensis]